VPEFNTGYLLLPVLCCVIVMVQCMVHLATCRIVWVSGGAVGWGTAPQDGRFRVPFPVESLENFQVTYLLSAFSSPGVHSASTKWVQGIALGVKCGQHVELTTLPSLNVKIRMEAQHSIPPLNLHDLLQESFTFTFIYRIVMMSHQN
jgi:hypothetical protein